MARETRPTHTDATGQALATCQADFTPPTERWKRPLRATAWTWAWAALAGLAWLGVWPILDRGLVVTGMGDGHAAGLAQLVLFIGLWVPLGLILGGCFDKTEHVITVRTGYKVFLLLETWCVALLALYVLQLGHPERGWRVIAELNPLHMTAEAVTPVGVLLGLIVVGYLRVFHAKGAQWSKQASAGLGVVFYILYKTVFEGSIMASIIFSVILAAAWYPWIVGFLEGRFVCGARRRLLLLLVLFFAGAGWLLFGWLFFIICLILLGAEVVAVKRRSLPLRAVAAVLWTVAALAGLWRALFGTGYVPTVEEGACVLFVIWGAAMVWLWRCGLADALTWDMCETTTSSDKDEKALPTGSKSAI